MKLKVREKGISNYYIIFCTLVDQRAITDNPAYEEGKLYITSILVLHINCSYVIWLYYST